MYVCVWEGGGGGGLEGSIESPLDTKFHLHWKLWINLIDVGHFSFYFSSKSQQILLPVNVCKIAG